MTRERVARLGFAALILAAWPARADVPAPGAAGICRARASSLPAEAHPGQQLLWRLEIERAAQVTEIDWIEPPAFPGFRVEWLPGRPEREAVGPDGTRWIARVEERALFAERAGEFVIAPRGLRCTLAGGASVEAGIPPTRVRVNALPTEGQPADFSGLVGALGLDVALRPRALTLGQSARLEVTLHGDANLWDARDPLADRSRFAELEVFAARPRLVLEPGVQLGVRREFAYDVVPLREGRIAIPALRVPYFDPALGRYDVAVSRPLEIEVGPRAAGTSAPRAALAVPSAARAKSRAWTLGAGALLALAAAGALVWLRRRRARRLRADAIRAALADPASGDETARLARALRLALAAQLPEARSAAVEELRAPAGASAACERALALLARVERSRFDPLAPGPPRADVIAAIEALARDRAR